MQRLFSTFPGGRPGVGLLLLRVVTSMAMLMEAWKLATADQWRWPMIAIACVALASAALLLAGFLTPFAAAAAAVAALAGSSPSVVSIAAFAAAIVLLGPGAFSVDARLFGRREIVIGE